MLYALEGDPERFRERATETPGIESVERSVTEDGWTYAVVEARPLATPMYDAIHRARTRPGLVVRKPVVYRDGAIHFRVVGFPEALQAAFDRAAESIDVRIDEIETVRGDPDRPATASEHLRKAEAKLVRAGMDGFDPEP